MRQERLRTRLAAVVRALDARRLAVVLLLFLPVFGGLREKLGDPDLWWHLEAGRWIVEHGAVPWQDPFSSTAAGRPWLAYSWLPEILDHELASRIGFCSLVWLRAVLGVAIVAGLYAACRAAGARSSAAVLTAALAGLASSGAWGERPQAIALALFVALVCLLADPARRSRLAWLAPPIVLLWANVHVSFFVGVGLLGVFAVGDSFEGRPSRPLWVALGLSAAATLANPYGIHLLAHLPTMIRQPELVRVVREFQSPDFSSPLGAVIGAYLLFAVVTFLRGTATVSLAEIGAVAATLAAGLYMVKNVPFFAIASAPIVARRLDSIARSAAPPTRAVETPPVLLALHWAVVAVALAAALVIAPRSRGWRENVDPAVFPVAASDFVAEHHRGERLFNDFDWGGFLIFRLYPQMRPSIDGRTQVYGSDLLAAYLRTHFVAPGWRTFLDRSRPDVVLWPREGALATMLRTSPEWRVEYDDGNAVVFVRSGA